MVVFLDVNEDNRIIALSSTRGSENDIELDIPEEHEVWVRPLVYRYDNGQLVKDEVYQQQQIQEREEKASKPSPEKQMELMQLALDDLIMGGMF